MIRHPHPTSSLVEKGSHSSAEVQSVYFTAPNQQSGKKNSGGKKRKSEKEKNGEKNT